MGRPSDESAKLRRSSTVKRKALCESSQAAQPSGGRCRGQVFLPAPASDASGRADRRPGRLGRRPSSGNALNYGCQQAWRGAYPHSPPATGEIQRQGWLWENKRHVATLHRNGRKAKHGSHVHESWPERRLDTGAAPVHPKEGWWRTGWAGWLPLLQYRHSSCWSACLNTCTFYTDYRMEAHCVVCMASPSSTALYCN